MSGFVDEFVGGASSTFAHNASIPVHIGLFDSDKCIVQIGQRTDDIVSQPTSGSVQATMEPEISGGTITFEVDEALKFSTGGCYDTGLILDQYYIGVEDDEGVPRLWATGSLASDSGWEADAEPYIHVDGFGFEVSEMFPEREQ